jgi:hypothetical protein
VELTRALGAYISSGNGKIRIQLNFLAIIKNGEPKLADAKEQASRDEDISELKWFTADEAGRLPPGEFMSSLIYELVRDWSGGISYPLDIYRDAGI